MVSSWVFLLVAARLCVAASPALFPYEKVTLDPSLSKTYPTLLTPSLGKKQCRLLPGDKDWPSAADWKTVSTLVGGNLVAPLPIASPCYAGANYNAAACANIVENWENPDLHADHPTSLMNPLETGLSCLPTTNPNSGNCTQGTYPVQVINAQNVRDIQVGVLVANNRNLRLVIKNTGHDFLGKSAGTGSLSIRTHAMKDVQLIKDYKSDSYSGPAYKVGAGIQVHEVYEATNRDGYVMVGGSCRTVGYSGGFVQGGGESPLSALYGLAADQVLEFNVVTANGTFLTVTPTQNSDLYWALRGGGGSTFAIVASVTARAYKTFPATLAKFSFGPSAADLERAKKGDDSRADFWDVIKTYLSVLPTYADNNIYSGFWVKPQDATSDAVFSMDPFVGWSKTPAQVNAFLKPIIDKAATYNITITPNVTTHSTFYDTWSSGFAETPMGHWNQQLVSRMLPRENFVDSAKFDKTFSAMRGSTKNGTMLVGFGMTAKLNAGNIENSVHPSWRPMILFAIAQANWDSELRDLNKIGEIRKQFVGPQVQPWRDASPTAGSYLNEGNRDEPNINDAWWGSNYPRLLEIKNKWDPNGVFFAETAVGSDKWTTGADHRGRLCPV